MGQRHIPPTPSLGSICAPYTKGLNSWFSPWQNHDFVLEKYFSINFFGPPTTLPPATQLLGNGGWSGRKGGGCKK